MIEGVVDGVPEEDTLSGWAIDRDGPARLTAEAWLGKKRIASAPVDVSRQDIGGDHGFLLRLGRPAALIASDLTVRVKTADGDTHTLIWHPPLIARLRARKLGHAIADLPEDLRAEALAAARAPMPDRTAKPLANRAKAPPAADTGYPRPETGWSGPLGHILVPVGVTSRDGLAITGHDGHIFLRSGTNDLESQFRGTPDDPKVVALADQWRELLQARTERLRTQGVRYLQLVVPEKVSIVPEFWHEPITVPTPLLTRLERDLIGSGVPYLSGFALLRGESARAALFRKVGTHLTADGTRKLFAGVCRALDLDPPFMEDDERHQHLCDGDFAHIFPSTPLLEQIDMIDGPALRAAGAELAIVESSIPKGGHIGARMIWHNPTAPVDRSVLAFGNSFFELGGACDCLSWWCARTFRRFAFVWTPDLDYDLIKLLKPDIVIGQTIERFLIRVPTL